MIVIRDIIAHKKGIVKGKESLIVPQPTRKAPSLLVAPGYSYFAAQKREFFAAPLVSELPDGFGSNANLIRYTFGVRSYAWHTGAAANAKRTPCRRH